MLSSFFGIAALSLLASTGSASPISQVKRLKGRTASTLEATDNYVSLVRTKGSHSTTARFLGKSGDVVQLADIEVEEEWAIPITFGDESVVVILDTGSSDTWLAQSGFTCINENGQETQESECAFGPLYNGTFTLGEIDDENFSIEYGDGEYLIGNVGYTDVTVGNITVTKQQVNLVYEAFWEGDGITSGLMGIAYSALTSDFAGTNADYDNDNVTGTAEGDQEPYSPVFETMLSQGLEPALFTLVLERSSDENNDVPGGYIAFGGTPPLSGTVGDYAETEILIHEYYEYPPLTATNRSFYSILPEAYVYADKAGGSLTSYATSYDGIVDSGTTLLYVPTEVADGYLASFDPAPTEYEGYYYYDCNSEAPYFGMTIGGTTFNISSADIIVPDSGYEENGVDYCLIGVIDGGSGVDTFPIFGDVFLKNVVAVFDVGANLLRFAQHSY